MTHSPLLQKFEAEEEKGEAPPLAFAASLFPVSFCIAKGEERLQFSQLQKGQWLIKGTSLLMQILMPWYYMQ